MEAIQYATEHEYKVLMTHIPVAKPKGRQRWRATLLGFPYLVEEAYSREQAILQIKKRIADMLHHAEIVTLRAPTLPLTTGDDGDELAALGWDDHGLFKDDAEALQLFDQIERERDNQMVSEQMVGGS